MRRSVSLVVSLFALAFTVAAPATADFLNIKSTDPINHLYANNKDSEVVAKITGDGGKANVDFVSFKMRGTDGVKYTAQGAWYGENWAVSLSRGGTLVECTGLIFRWNGDGDFWKVVVPRSCLNLLTNRIRVRAEMHSYLTAAPGDTGWTLAINRG